MMICLAEVTGEFDDLEYANQARVCCKHCGEENLHWEMWRTSRKWTLCNSLGDIHECPPVDADLVFDNLDLAERLWDYKDIVHGCSPTACRPPSPGRELRGRSKNVTSSLGA